jgi:CRP-like cAMP-binding protein
MTVAGVLDRLSRPDREVVEAHFTYHDYDTGKTVISHMEADRDVYFVLAGRVRATLYSHAGREVDYRDAGPGDMVGELAAIDGGPRSATVEALEPARLARLPAAAFQELVGTCPGFTAALLQHLSDQVRRLTERVFELSTLSMRDRLLRELMRLTEASGIQDGRAEIRPAPTHFELASRIGAYREAVSREMSALQKAGLLEKRGGALVLHDTARLSEMISAD